MNIKDFKVGQAAFSVTVIQGKKTEYRVSQCDVIKVGRRYVHVSETHSGVVKEYGLLHEEDENLTEKKDWGDRGHLFPTLEDANDFVEAHMLRRWLKSAAEWGKIEIYSLEQLREVKRILGGEAPKRAFRYSTYSGSTAFSGVVMAVDEKEAESLLRANYDSIFSSQDYSVDVWTVESDAFFCPKFPDIFECCGEE